jgi:DNA-cytosine methyltransferase
VDPRKRISPESARVVRDGALRSILQPKNRPSYLPNSGRVLLHLSQVTRSSSVAEDFLKRASGRYYTGEPVGRQLAASVVRALVDRRVVSGSYVKVIDPFGGDGRLVAWLVEACADYGIRDLSWSVVLWDLVDVGFDEARRRFEKLRSSGIDIHYETVATDAFSLGVSWPPSFDVVITNPPWELLKPDRREIERLEDSLRSSYIESMRSYDDWLAAEYPRSQPRRKFAGWGTNLSRVGLELSLRLARPSGIVGAVMPASLLADDQSKELRRHLLMEHALIDVSYYAAEAKHYGTADVASIALVVGANEPPSARVRITSASNSARVDASEVHLDFEQLDAADYVLPVAFGAGAVSILGKLAASFPTWAALEADCDAGFWAGREIDETGSIKWLVPLPAGVAPFLKGRMIDRFSVRQLPTQGVGREGWSPTASMAFERLAWRDVSRPNQKRRVIATIVPPGWALGNSLGVAYFGSGRPMALRALLGVMSSTVFEFQLRAHLATGHVSLGSLRKVAIPTFDELASDASLQHLVQKALAGDPEAETTADAHVALFTYRLTLAEYRSVLDLFPKMAPDEKGARLKAYAELMKVSALVESENFTSRAATPASPSDTQGRNAHAISELSPADGIFNHLSARLSDLDLRMVRAVPEGGNWKDIPECIPSRRLEQIRESYARGEGSRSTYYGRLRRDMPAYTINTYFNRPGNGCHMHPTQDRVLSQREAARLQSFPDSFEFLGPQGAVCTQIGNAVPPLLAFQIAKTLGAPGAYIDLFAGAGGMGLGFKWAGWRPVIANDLEPRFVATYRRNVHDLAIAGSITDQQVVEALIEAAETARRPGEPFWVLGGPPCQGFSTAGNTRSMEDPRNHLAWDYVRFLQRVKPDGFVFENVTGLLNMQGGKVFAEVKKAFASVMPLLYGAVVSAEEYAIPQRRKRVILVGRQDASGSPWAPPQVLTSLNSGVPSLFHPVEPAVSVEEAIGDLPPLVPGEDGSEKRYATPPRTAYQALMRGYFTPEEYLRCIARGDRSWPVTLNKVESVVQSVSKANSART